MGINGVNKLSFLNIKNPIVITERELLEFKSKLLHMNNLIVDVLLSFNSEVDRDNFRRLQIVSAHLDKLYDILIDKTLTDTPEG
jgi:ferredoxin-fold anticodon binding domain-containing protein